LLFYECTIIALRIRAEQLEKWQLPARAVAVLHMRVDSQAARASRPI